MSPPASRAAPARAVRVVGLDLGGTKAALCTDDGDTSRVSARLPTGPGFDLDALLTLLEREVFTGAAPPAALGIGFPGLVDARAGRVASSVILPRWHDVPLADELRRRFGVPFRVDNDVHNAARAECAYRPEGPADLLFVAVGTGIGGAVVVGGRVHGGAAGLAGEIGHLAVRADGPRCACGRTGCIGAIASGAAVEARLGIARGTLAAHLSAGDARALDALRDAARALGGALASAAHLLGPGAVVIGGGLADAPGFVTEAAAAFAREAFSEVARACPVERARAGYDAGAIGAALLAREGLPSPT